MVIGNADGAVAGGGANNLAHPSGIPQDKIDNIMSGISNTGDVKMNNHRKKLRQRFDIIKKLGQGTYGKVQLGINKETGQEVAIKTIKKCKIEAEADLIRIRREVQIMSSVQHPNIIHIYEVFENREKMVLVMEFAAGGELYDYLSERKVLSEEEARRIFRQVSTAVYYCHKHKICHRDLKLENILLDEHGNAKIADFGLSNVFDEQRLLATFCGSPLYASPEIVEGTPYQGPEVDCWSLGVLLYTLVYGSMPFDGSNFKRLVKQISQGDYYEPKKPSRASSLIRDMLTVCPRKRATIEQICSHWWVNENDNVSCLDLAENLANQTPVRLDVLLSLSPTSVTAAQLVVPSTDANAKANERVARSHSVGSIREMGNTEAERRILDMVAAGGEAALMPSPTRTITPAHSPVQTKRKLETTISTENAAGAVKKKEKPMEGIVDEPVTPPKTDDPMEIVEDVVVPTNSVVFSQKDMEMVGNLCAKLMQNSPPASPPPEQQQQSAATADVIAEQTLARQKTAAKLDAVEESPEETNATKVIKKFVNKHKTADLVAAINKISPEKIVEQPPPTKPPTSHVRKSSLPDESLSKFNTERRKSRILETAEKFQQMNNANADKPKKFVIPGVSVGNFKKEFERKASITSAPTSAERRALDRRAESIEQAAAAENNESPVVAATSSAPTTPPVEKYQASSTPLSPRNSLEGSDSKNSLTNFSLDEARRSMENSIALLRQAQNESSKEVDQLCAKTENFAVSDDPVSLAERERERKLKNARAIIGNAIQPGIRRPLPPYSMNGRSVSGSAVLPPQPPPHIAAARQNMSWRLGGGARPGSVDVPMSLSSSNQFNPLKTSPGAENVTPQQPAGTVKTSRAEITLKSATLPRRKTAKTEIQLDIKPRIIEQTPMHFTTEMQHPVPDLRSAPIREGPSPYSPITTLLHQRATSLEPREQMREHIIPIQRPSQVYNRTASNSTTRSGSLSRQSTIDSESEATTGNLSQSTITGSSQPIKKSPREFIIPIAVEGGGFITPREGSIEPSESSQTTSSRSTFSRLRPRRIGSLLPEADVEESLPFQKMRAASINRDGDDDSRFTLHRLRSSRPVKKVSQDNDSNSSGEEDDDDGFEILTAENLFSTLLQRVRALTNRLNVNNDITSGFPNSSRLLSNMRQSQSPFWNQEPFGRSNVSYSYTSETVEKKQVRLSNATGNVGAPWRHSMSRDLGSDMESMFSRTGATLPRGNKKLKNQHQSIPECAAGAVATTPPTDAAHRKEVDEPLDLADLDLSRLRLSKKDLETLSSITPGLPKCFQEQLLAKLPPTQARKLSRTLSMQNSSQVPHVRICKRSQSGGRRLDQDANEFNENIVAEEQQQPAKNSDQIPPSAAAAAKTIEENSATDRNTLAYRRSSSRSRYDYDVSLPSPAAEAKSRASSICRVSDDCSKSLCSSYSSDISDKYKYYSPYLVKGGAQGGKESDSSSVSPRKRYESISPRNSCLSPTSSSTPMAGRPPSGCLSPPVATTSDGSLRRRSSQRRISRFLRPDFFDENNDENPYVREKKCRERETQSVLREIREKSRESSRDRLSANSSECDNLLLRRKNSLPDSSPPSGQAERATNKTKANPRHVRNKSMEMYCDRSATAAEPEQNMRQRRSLSRSRELPDDKGELANKILKELQILSAVKSKHEQTIRECSVEKSLTAPVNACVLAEADEDKQAVQQLQQPATPPKEKTLVKKVKKIKPKSSVESSETTAAADGTTKITTVVKKVKKIVKKTDGKVTTQQSTSEGVEADQSKILNTDIDKPKRESRLKRPKSYPSKEQEKVAAAPAAKTPAESAILPTSKLPTTSLMKSSVDEATADAAIFPPVPMATNNNILIEHKENRLVRPKSYPVSKITPPKELKKTTTRGSGVSSSIPAASSTETTAKVPAMSRQSTSEEKSITTTPTTGRGSSDTSSSSDTKPTTIKKIIRVTSTKKSNPIAATTKATDGADCKETSPTGIPQLKDKSPEKKISKGLLYAIGQKFEKLRDSAMSKDRKSSSKIAEQDASTKKSSSDNTPTAGKIKEKSALLKKKKTKSADGNVAASKADNKPEAASTPVDGGAGEKPAKSDKRSRIDAMIRSLRERSVPRTSTITESGYIKRAVSVEEMPGTFNKCAVNRVLGLFKRFEKDDRKVRNTRSTSNIERQMHGSARSPIFQEDKIRRPKSSSHATKPIPNMVIISKPEPAELASERKSQENLHQVIQVKKMSCPDCIQDQAQASCVPKRHTDSMPKSEHQTSSSLSSKEPPMNQSQGSKDKRKALMLDLVKLERLDNSTACSRSKPNMINGNGIYSNLPYSSGCTSTSSTSQQQSESSSHHSYNNNNNNNNNNNSSNNNNNNSCISNNNNNTSFSHSHSHHSSHHTHAHPQHSAPNYPVSSQYEINRNNVFTLSSENIANYSSDSRSCQDDCASTSTFLSPTDEPELYFDNWSVCSEDNYTMATPSPTVSRLSRASQFSSPTRDGPDPNESVIDRIKRRSFYSRFNEKKPKRTSSIVGPAARDYYRESSGAATATSKPRSRPTASERASSPDITQEFFRPLKLSPVGTELKPPIYKSSIDYTTKPRKSLNDIFPSTSPSFLSKRYTSSLAAPAPVSADNDYLLSSSAGVSRTKAPTSSYDTSNGTSGIQSSYYSTYNPKRRSSYNLNGSIPTTNVSSSNIDGYATVGRRTLRPYDQRTVSLLDPTVHAHPSSSTVGASSGSSSLVGSTSFRREHRTPVRDYSSISRSNSHYRAPSATRSPTNI